MHSIMTLAESLSNRVLATLHKWTIVQNAWHTIKTQSETTVTGFVLRSMKPQTYLEELNYL